MAPSARSSSIWLYNPFMKPSAVERCTVTMPSFKPPHASITSSSRTPVYSILPTWVQSNPLPAQMAQVPLVTSPSAFNSSSVKVRGLFTPPPTFNS